MPDPITLRLLTADGEQRLELTPAEAGFNLADLLRRRSAPLNTRCGERGLCDGCLVELVAGQVVHLADGAVVAAGAEPRLLHGCQHRLAGPGEVVLRLPERSRLAYRPQVVDEFKIDIPAAHDPLREPGDPRPLGVAIDIGTTTVAAMVVDLDRGEILGRASAFNGQLPYGDNVLTRIDRCQSDPAAVGELQRAVCEETLHPLVAEALQQAGRSPDEIACAAVAGNTIMLHLFAGVDPSSMGSSPFPPTFLAHRVEPGARLGLAGETPVHLLPSASAYVGADLCAGALATGLLYDEGPSLLVDVGTNGEILFKHGDRLFGCATAAGPAFEGAGLSCGLRAGAGAIAHLDLAAEPFGIATELVGAGPGQRRVRPTGVCGSAYIDFLAEGRRVGLLTPTGRFTREPCNGLAEHLTEPTERGRALRLATGLGRREIVIAELDVATLLQAKAAIAAGIRTLMEQVGVTAGDLRTVYLAGGFGMHLRVPNAIGAGLLPNVRPEQVELVGNTSLAGAWLGLLDRSALTEMEKIRDQMQLIELNLDPQFEMTYIEELMLP